MMIARTSSTHRLRMSSNLEKQAEEILVLQSIFEEKFRRLDDDRYEILIEFDMPTLFTIRFDQQSTAIRHLPPLSLFIQYHDEYPSESPPSFVLSCFYFSRLALQQLCEKLDQQPFLPGEVCVYDWIELIRHEISDELILPGQMTDETIQPDPRALHAYDWKHAEQIYRKLIDYNEEREQDSFRNHLQTCLICAEIIGGEHCLRLRRCGHFYCRACLDTYVRMTLGNGQFGERLVCPQKECRQPLLPTEIKQIIRDERLYERYEQFTLKHGLESMADILWCPRCQSAVFDDQSDDHLAMCDRCRYTFCKKCKESFHPQTMCPKDYALEQAKLKQQEERDRIEQRKQAALAQFEEIKKQKKSDVEQRIAQQEYRQLTISLSEQDALLQEILTKQRMDLLNTQCCPKCHAVIEKNGGCSHMRCSRCGTSFTWQALTTASAPATTAFLEEDGRTVLDLTSMKGMVHEVATIVNTEPYENAEVVQSTGGVSTEDVEDLRIAIDNRTLVGSLILNRVRPCPNLRCQKNNVKFTRDNWMVCDACMKQYCFLCGRTVNGSKHYERKCDRFTSF